MDTPASGGRREYVAMVWVGDEPGVRVRLNAVSLEDARAQLAAEFGEATVSLKNDADARKPR